MIFVFRFSLQEAFAQLDQDGNGKLSRKEAEAALGQVLSEADLDYFLLDMKTDDNGEVEWHDFLKAMKERMREPESVKMLKEAFRLATPSFARFHFDKSLIFPGSLRARVLESLANPDLRSPRSRPPRSSTRSCWPSPRPAIRSWRRCSKSWTWTRTAKSGWRILSDCSSKTARATEVAEMANSQTQLPAIIASFCDFEHNNFFSSKINTKDSSLF